MSQTKSIVYAATRSFIMTKTYNKAYELTEKLASSHYQIIYDRTIRKNVLRVIQMNALNALSVQIVALSKLMQNLKNKT